MWPHASGRDVRDGGERAVGGGGGLFPLNEAPRRCEQHPPIVAALRDGWEWDGDWTWTSRRRGARKGGGGYAARQAARARERAAKCCRGRGGLSK